MADNHEKNRFRTLRCDPPLAPTWSLLGSASVCQYSCGHASISFAHTRGASVGGICMAGGQPNWRWYDFLDSWTVGEHQQTTILRINFRILDDLSMYQPIQKYQDAVTLPQSPGIQACSALYAWFLDPSPQPGCSHGGLLVAPDVLKEVTRWHELAAPAIVVPVTRLAEQEVLVERGPFRNHNTIILPFYCCDHANTLLWATKIMFLSQPCVRVVQSRPTSSKDLVCTADEEKCSDDSTHTELTYDERKNKHNLWLDQTGRCVASRFPVSARSRRTSPIWRHGSDNSYHLNRDTKPSLVVPRSWKQPPPQLAHPGHFGRIFGNN